MTRSAILRLRKRRTEGAARAAGAARTARPACLKWCKRNTLMWTGCRAAKSRGGTATARIWNAPPMLFCDSSFPPELPRNSATRGAHWKLFSAITDCREELHARRDRRITKNQDAQTQAARLRRERRKGQALQRPFEAVLRLWERSCGAHRPESGDLPLRILQDALSPRPRAAAAKLYAAQLAHRRRNTRGPLATKRMDLRLEPRHAAGDRARHARSAG